MKPVLGRTQFLGNGVVSSMSLERTVPCRRSFIRVCILGVSHSQALSSGSDMIRTYESYAWGISVAYYQAILVHTQCSQIPLFRSLSLNSSLNGKIHSLASFRISCSFTINFRKIQSWFNWMLMELWRSYNAGEDST